MMCEEKTVCEENGIVAMPAFILECVPKWLWNILIPHLKIYWCVVL